MFLLFLKKKRRRPDRVGMLRALEASVQEALEETEEKLRVAKDAEARRRLEKRKPSRFQGECFAMFC